MVLTVTLVVGPDDSLCSQTALDILGESSNTALVWYYMGDLHLGLVSRTMRFADGTEVPSVVDLVHACAACTVRYDLLPLIAETSLEGQVDRLVVRFPTGTDITNFVRSFYSQVLVHGFTAAHSARIDLIVAAISTTDLESATSAVAFDPDSHPEGVPTPAQELFGLLDAANVVVSPDHENHEFREALSFVNPGVPLLASPPEDLPRPFSRRSFEAATDPLVRRRIAPTSVGDGWRTALWVAHAPLDPWLLDSHLDVLADNLIRLRGRLQLATQPDIQVAVDASSQHLSLRPAGRFAAVDTPTRLELLAASQSQLEAALGVLEASLFRPQSLTSRPPLGMDPFEELWESDHQGRQAS